MANRTLLCLVWALVLANLTLEALAVRSRTFKANIKGDVLILDAGSMFYRGNHPMGYAIPTAQECSLRCKKLPGCNTWNFCNKTEGCGLGCGDWTGQHPALPIDPETYNPINAPLPVKGFGPFPYRSGNGCQVKFDEQNNPSNTDSWPYTMCSLKRVAKAAAPEFWSSDPEEGWISGTFESTCPKAISINACAGCLSLEPAKRRNCLKCARNVRQNPVDALIGFGELATGCGICYKSARNINSCVACVDKEKACSSCVFDQYGPKKTDITSCINCVRRYGDARQPPCARCAASKNVGRCMSCMEKTKNLICKDSANESFADPSGCILDEDSVCADCTNFAKPFDRCLACATRKPFSRDCSPCVVNFNTSQKQAQCFDCAEKAKSVYSGCSDCLGSYSNHPSECISCMVNPETETKGKEWCFGCTNWYEFPEPDADKREECFQCLQKPTDNFFQSCANF